MASPSLRGMTKPHLSWQWPRWVKPEHGESSHCWASSDLPQRFSSLQWLGGLASMGQTGLPACYPPPPHGSSLPQSASSCSIQGPLHTHEREGSDSMWPTKRWGGRQASSPSLSPDPRRAPGCAVPYLFFMVHNETQRWRGSSIPTHREATQGFKLTFPRSHSQLLGEASFQSQICLITENLCSFLTVPSITPKSPLFLRPTSHIKLLKKQTRC